MKTVSLLQFRRDAEGVLRQIQRGQRLLLTYRGKPVARLEPLANPEIPADDPLYSLPRGKASKKVLLSNEEIDKLVYGN